MRWTSVFVAMVFLGCSTGGRRDQSQAEERRRASLELQSVMQMVTSHEIPPVEFEFNSAKLFESSYELLDRIAEILINYPKLKLIVEGHTDDIGSAEYNNKLSRLRANSVRTYLSLKGIHPSSVRAYGFGKSRPIVNDKSERGRALNRRVEFRLTRRSWETIY